jgi:C4-dicarboxylate-specific signal transduction histidine kinase
VFLHDTEQRDLILARSEGCPYAQQQGFTHEPCMALARKVFELRALLLIGEKDLLEAPGAVPREECTETQAIVVPIVANQRALGVLAVMDKKGGRPFHRNEVAFIKQVATKLALVIHNVEAYRTINQLNHSLEEKVLERTSQLEKVIHRLQETQTQLMQSDKLATIGTLAGGIAHEINNPMSAILANVQLLKLDFEDSEHRDSLNLIEKGAQRCKKIVENLLNYSRQSTSEHRSLSINKVISDTLELLGHQIRNANVDVYTEFKELPPVLGAMPTS